VISWFQAFAFTCTLYRYVAANGKAMFHLYVWHHLLSILFWPVIRGAMLTLKTINTPLGMFVQLGFVASFFLSRIVVGAVQVEVSCDP
jgi:hypothetical protein